MTKPEPKPKREDVELRRDRSGDWLAVETKTGRVVSSGFDDESDFNEWAEQFFK